MKSWYHLFAAGVSAAFILSCGDGGTGVQDPVVSTVRVTPAVDTIEVGGSVQLQAIALDDAGSAVGGVTASWRSQPSAVASVSSTGEVTGLSVGEATVTATVAGVSDEAVVTVSAHGEAHGDERAPGMRHGVHVLDAVDLMQELLQRRRDQPLDLGGRQPRRFHDDVGQRHDDLRLLLARCHVERDRAAEQRDQDEQRRDVVLEEDIDDA